MLDTAPFGKNGSPHLCNVNPKLCIRAYSLDIYKPETVAAIWVSFNTSLGSSKKEMNDSGANDVSESWTY